MAFQKSNDANNSEFCIAETIIFLTLQFSWSCWNIVEIISEDVEFMSRSVAILVSRLSPTIETFVLGRCLEWPKVAGRANSRAAKPG